MAVIARVPIDRVKDFARECGWTELRLLSSTRNTYNTGARHAFAAHATPTLSNFNIRAPAL
jgi:predicted dithiol-disulfide oxidoreductase (DUF899 family)